MKPLMKHEFKRILLPGLILVLINSIGNGLMLNWEIASYAEDYIKGTVAGGRTFINMVLEIYVYIMIANVGIIMWLVYSQFHEDKVEGTGDFIATLPYTQKEKFIKKILIGTIPIFISFVLSIIIQYTLFDTYFYYTEYQCSNSIFEKYLMAQSGYANTLGVMVNIYLGLVIWYLFLVVFQYSIYNTVGSIVIGGLSILSIPYIFAGTIIYLGLAINFEIDSVEPIINVLNIIVICIAPIQYKMICYKDGVHGESLYALSSHYYLELLMLICIVAILFIVGKGLAQKYGLRSRKTFMVNKVVEYIFKIVVTLASTLTPVIFLQSVLGGSTGGLVIMTLFMILAGVIGYIISHKITLKGRE